MEKFEVSVCVCVKDTTMYVGSPVNGIIGSLNMQHRFREPHSDPLQKQHVLLITEQFF